MILYKLLNTEDFEEREQCISIIHDNYNGKHDFSFINDLNNKDYKFIVAKEKNEVVGFGAYGETCYDFDSYGVFWCNVKKDKRGLHIGENLLKERIKLIKECGGKVVVAASKVPWHLERLGFKKILEKQEGEFILLKDLNN